MFNIEKKYLIYICVIVIIFSILGGLYMTTSNDIKYDQTDAKSVVRAFARALIRNDQAVVDEIFPKDARGLAAPDNLNRAYDLMADVPEESILICEAADLPTTGNIPTKDNEFYIFDIRRAINNDNFYANKIHVFCGRRGSNIVIINLDSQGAADKGSVGRIVFPNENEIPEDVKEILVSEAANATARSTAPIIIQELRYLKAATIMFFGDNVDNLKIEEPEIGLLAPHFGNVELSKSLDEYIFMKSNGKWWVGCNLATSGFSPKARATLAEILKEWNGGTLYGDIDQSKVYEGEEIVYMIAR